MRIKEFIFLFFKSLNPLDYKMLVQRKKRDTFKYFFMLLFFCILLSAFTNLPRLSHMRQNFNTTLSKFERFEITGIDIELREPLILLNSPKIVLDLSENRSDLIDENILITKSNIMWRKFKPSLWDFSLYKTETKPVQEYSDVLESAHSIRGIYWLLFFFLLPSIFLIVFSLNLIKYSLLILMFTLVAYLIMLITKRKIKLLLVWRTAVFTISIMVFLDLVISPLFNLGVLSFISYIFMFSLAMLLTFEKGMKIKNAKA